MDTILSYQTNQFSPQFGPTRYSIRDHLIAAKNAGFTALGFDVFTVDEYGSTGETLETLAAQLANFGLTCTDIVPIVAGADLPKNLATTRHLARLGEAVGAQICLLTLGSDVADITDGALRSNLRECVGVIEAANMRTAVEFVPYLPLNSVSAAYALCDELGFERTGLALDTFHVFAGDQFAELSGLISDEIALVQFADAILPATDIATASRSGRRIPGSGNLNLQSFVDLMRRMDYRGVISTEVLSDEVRKGPLGIFVQSLRTSMSHYWP